MPKHKPPTPIIERDDQFEDLKYLSTRDIDAAQLDPAHPKSGPMLMR